MRFLLLIAVSLGLTCAPLCAEENANARRILEQVEKRLLDAKSIEIYAYVDTKEPYPRSMAGTLKLSNDGKLHGDFQGTIGPDKAKLLVDADGQALTISLNEDQRSGVQPKALREALLVSLMRIGFSNTLIAFSQLKPPEHAEGGVEDWIKIENVQLREAAVAQGYHNGEIALQFGFRVNGKPGGYTRLWISTQSGLPLRREQFFTYQTADGKEAVMRTDERYTTFIADP